MDSLDVEDRIAAETIPILHTQIRFILITVSLMSDWIYIDIESFPHIHYIHKASLQFDSYDVYYSNSYT